MVGIALTVALSNFELRSAGGQQAWARLSWRVPAIVSEVCRSPTEQELANLPSHMQAQEICEGLSTPFRLTLAVDGDLVLDEIIRPGGARQDRPVVVFFEEPISPGLHTLTVAFEPTDESVDGSTLGLETRRELAMGDVVLFTMNAERTGLLARPEP